MFQPDSQIFSHDRLVGPFVVSRCYLAVISGAESTPALDPAAINWTLSDFLLRSPIPDRVTMNIFYFFLIMKKEELILEATDVVVVAILAGKESLVAEELHVVLVEASDISLEFTDGLQCVNCAKQQN
jgi:hypothetical protein